MSSGAFYSIYLARIHFVAILGKAGPRLLVGEPEAKGVAPGKAHYRMAHVPLFQTDRKCLPTLIGRDGGAQGKAWSLVSFDAARGGAPFEIDLDKLTDAEANILSSVLALPIVSEGGAQPEVLPPIRASVGFKWLMLHAVRFPVPVQRIAAAAAATGSTWPGQLCEALGERWSAGVAAASAEVEAAEDEFLL